MKSIKWTIRTQTTIFVYIASFLLSGLLYYFVKSISLTFVVDILNDNNLRTILSSHEAVIFTLFIIVSTISIGTIYLMMEKLKKMPSMKILNEIGPGSYHPLDHKKVAEFYKRISIERNTRPKKYTDISKYHPKSVYSLIGGWRAGKTTAAGMLLNAFREDGSISVMSETYHDCFNFGNIDESIASFFNSLAVKTDIPEFNNLSKVSSPSIDMGFNIGPVNIKHVFSSPIRANETRKLIFEKLNATKKVHLVVLDDIDRLLPEEQYQWLKVIELLGKFNHKLILVIPIHLNEVTKNLNETYKLNPRYIDKIIPMQNRLSTGVDISYVKSLIGVSGRSSSRIKRVYTKYLITLAIKQAISTLAADTIHDRDEWVNEVNRGGISQIAGKLADRLPVRSQSSREILFDGMRVEHRQTVWFQETKENFDSSELNKLISGRFLPYTQRGSSVEISDLNLLRKVTSLINIFGPHSYQVGPTNYVSDMPDDLPESGWKDYWLEILWPIVKEITNDPNLSSHFTYQDIEKDIAELMSTSSEEDERKVLVNQVLQWKYYN